MKTILSLACSLLLVLMPAVLRAQADYQPEISRYGQVSAVPGVGFRADPNMPYRIVVEVASSDTINDVLSQPLELTARLVNLLAMDGIDKSKRSIAVIFHNMGSYCIQNDEAYKRKYGRANPNKEALMKLAEAGVSFYVCGQSTVKRNIAPDEILPPVQIATSFLTAYTTFQLKGYAALKF